MAKSKNYVISETGEFPAQYKVLHLNEDGIYRPVFGPDPDLEDAERKCAEMNGERSRNDKGQLVADDLSTPDVNEAYVVTLEDGLKEAGIEFETGLASAYKAHIKTAI